MSYARFGWGGSDVYVFRSVDGHLVCCACFLVEADGGESTDWRTSTSGPSHIRLDPLRPLPSKVYREMLMHLFEHITAAHHVPKLTMSRLHREMVEARQYEMEQ